MGDNPRDFAAAKQMSNLDLQDVPHDPETDVVEESRELEDPLKNDEDHQNIINLHKNLNQETGFCYKNFEELNFTSFDDNVQESFAKAIKEFQSLTEFWSKIASETRKRNENESSDSKQSYKNRNADLRKNWKKKFDEIEIQLKQFNDVVEKRISEDSDTQKH